MQLRSGSNLATLIPPIMSASIHVNRLRIEYWLESNAEPVYLCGSTEALLRKRAAFDLILTSHAKVTCDGRSVICHSLPRAY